MNTKIEYMYRDGDNWKAWREEVLEGTLNEKQIALMFKLLDNDGCFVPSDVNLEHLHEATQAYGASYHYDVDHPFHELLSITTTLEEPTIEMTARILYRKWLAQKGKWNTAMQIGRIRKSRATKKIGGK